MKIFLVVALFALFIYSSSAVPVFEKRHYASRVRAAADGVAENQQTGGAGWREVREGECPSGTCNVINVPSLNGGFYHDVGGYLGKPFQNIGEAATPALIAKIISREIIRQNRAKQASLQKKVIRTDYKVSSSGTKIIGAPAPNNNVDQTYESRWITVNSDRVALESTFTRRVPVLFIPQGADIDEIRESDIPKFTVPLSFLTKFNRTPKITPAPVSLKPASGSTSSEPYKVPQRTPAAPSPWETSKVPGQPSLVILDDSETSEEEDSEEQEGNPQLANSGPKFVILYEDEDEQDVPKPPNNKQDGLIYIKPENPRKPVRDIAQTYGVPLISGISPEGNALPHRVYDRPVLPPARSSIPSVSSSRLSVPKSILPTTKHDGTRVNKTKSQRRDRTRAIRRKSRQPGGTRVTKTKYRKPDGTRVTKTKSRQPDGTRVTKTKFQKPDGTRVTKTKFQKPDGTRVTKTKSRQPDGTKVTKTKSRQPDGTRVTKKKTRTPDGTRVTKTKSLRPDGTKVTRTKSQEPDGSRVTRTSSQQPYGTTVTRTISKQPDGTRVTKIDNSEILDETVVVSNDDVTAIDFLEDGQNTVNEQDSILISKDGKLLQGAKDGRDIKITQKDGITIVDLYDDSDDDETILTTDENDVGKSTNQVSRSTTNRNVVKKSKVVESDQRTIKRSNSEIKKSKIVKKGRNTKISKSQKTDGTRVTRTTSKQTDGTRVKKIGNSEILDETVIVSNDDVTAIDFLEDGQKTVNEQDSILISKDGKLLQGAKYGRDIKITQKDGNTIVDFYDDSGDDETILTTDENAGARSTNQVSRSTTNRNVVKKSKVVESDQRTIKRSNSEITKSKIVKKGRNTKISKSQKTDGTRVTGTTSKQTDGTRVKKNGNSEILDETVIVSNDDVTAIDFLEDGQKTVNEQDSILISKDGKLLQGAKDGRDIKITQKDGNTIVDFYDDSDDDETILTTDENAGARSTNQVTRSSTNRNVAKKSKVVESTQRIIKRSDSKIKKSRIVKGRDTKSSKSQKTDGTRVTRTTSKQTDGTRVKKIGNSEILDETVIVSNDDVTAIDFLEDGQKNVNEQDSILISKDGKLLQGAKDGRDIKITQKDGNTIVDFYDDSDDDETILITDENEGGQSTNQVTKATSDRNVVKKLKVIESDQKIKRSDNEIQKSKIVNKVRDTEISKTVTNDVNISKRSKYSATGIQRPDISPAYVEGSRRPYFTAQDSNESEESAEDNGSDTDDETVLTANGNVSIEVENEGSIIVKKDGSLVREAGDNRKVVVKKVGDAFEVDIWDDNDDPDVEGYETHVYDDSDEN